MEKHLSYVEVMQDALELRPEQSAGYLTKQTMYGMPGGSVSGAHISWPRGHEFEPQLGHRVHLKKKKKSKLCKAQRGTVTHLESHSRMMAELGLEPEGPDS